MNLTVTLIFVPYGTISTIRVKTPSKRIQIFLNPQLFLSQLKNSPSPHVIRFVTDLLFSTLESRFKNIQIHQMRVGESRIQKEKVLDSKIYGYLWTGP